jgi:hypothetical protein
VTSIVNGNITGNLTVGGTSSLSGALTYGGVTLSNAVTGTGNMVLATSPTLTTPNLGTPSAVTLTNATGLSLSTGTTGTLAVGRGGTGVTTLSGLAYGNGTSAFTAATSAQIAAALSTEPVVNANAINTTTYSGISVSHYIPFVSQSTGGYQQLFVDSGVTYNPVSNTLGAAVISGSTGNFNDLTTSAGTVTLGGTVTINGMSTSVNQSGSTRYGDTASTIGAQYSTSVGYQAGRYNSGNYTTAIGYQSLYGASFASQDNRYCTAVGALTLTSVLDNAVNNTAVGYKAGWSISTGDVNTLVGDSSGDAITSGSGNTAIGFGSLGALTTGVYNLGLGYLSGASLNTGNYNVVVGSTDAAHINGLSSNVVLSDGNGVVVAKWNAAGTKIESFNQLQLTTTTTLTASQINSESHIFWTGGAATVTLPSAADIISTVPFPSTNYAVRISITNAGGGTMTLAAGSATTIYGGATVPANTGATFLIVKTTGSACDVYRV